MLCMPINVFLVHESQTRYTTSFGTAYKDLVFILFIFPFITTLVFSSKLLNFNTKAICHCNSLFTM